MNKGQSERTCQGQVSGVNLLGYESENKTNMCEYNRENESERSNMNASSLVKKETKQSVLRKTEEVSVTGESWEEELFTTEDMIVQLNLN